jgi:uncharacterized protein YehS (DUF1456 family)
MKNSDVLRRIRYIFDLSDSKIIKIFGLGGLNPTRTVICDWLKREDDPAFKECKDRELAIFLNGFIILKRGEKDGPKPEPEQHLTNNIIFRKLKIALDLKAEDVIDIFKLADFNISKSELSSFFRKPGHRNYTKCKAQVLRNFLKGMQLKYRKDDTSSLK